MQLGQRGSVAFTVFSDAFSGSTLTPTARRSFLLFHPREAPFMARLFLSASILAYYRICDRGFESLDSFPFARDFKRHGLW